MAHPFDLNQLMADISTAASDILKKDLSTVSGFSRSQLEALAKQAAWIAEATAKNEINAEQREFFLQNLAEMARNFVKVLQGLAAITIEKLWNAVVNVLWGAIRGAVGNIPLPLPG